MHEQQAQDVPRSHPRAATQLTPFAADGGDSVRTNVDHAYRLYRSNPVQIMSVPASWEVSIYLFPDSSLSLGA